MSNPNALMITAIPTHVMEQLLAYRDELNATLAAGSWGAAPLTLEDAAYHLLAESLQRWMLAQARTNNQTEPAE